MGSLRPVPNASAGAGTKQGKTPLAAASTGRPFLQIYELEWLSKNFVLQGAVFFRGEGMLEHVEVLKKDSNAAGRIFCDAIRG